MDGVYCNAPSGELVFHRTAEPTSAELATLAGNIHRRILLLLKRRGLLKNEDDSNADKQLDALSACGRVALSIGNRERAGPALALVGDDEVEQPRGGHKAVVGGVNVYASAALAQDDRETLERVARYLLRGPLALSRLKLRPDGLLTYRLKKADKRGNTVLVMSPMELMARLASLIPAPGHPARKYFGLLASGAKDRAKVVPKPTHKKHKHMGGDDIAPPRPQAHRLPWREILKRVWNIEALACPNCGATMTALASITDPDEAARFMAHLGESPSRRTTGPPKLAA